VTLPRGFKANAERAAAEIRAKMGLRPYSPVDIVQVAAERGIPVLDAGDLIDIQRLEEIERLQAFAFSAATFKIEDRHFIVTNPIRTPERRVSDIAHELAHVCLEHDLSEIREFAGIPFRTCKPDEEEQATAFGGTLMLPRPLLLRGAGQGLGPAEIAAKYGVSLEMARFRFNTTGVARQLQRH